VTPEVTPDFAVVRLAIHASLLFLADLLRKANQNLEGAFCAEKIPAHAPLFAKLISLGYD
jgi:hypothetical protein